MGDPKKQRKKFSSPTKRWNKERIDEEKDLINEYGLKNKKEIWKAESKLRNFTRQAKRLIAIKTKQAEKEKEQIISKLKTLSLLPSTAGIVKLKAMDITAAQIYGPTPGSFINSKGSLGTLPPHFSTIILQAL